MPPPDESRVWRVYVGSIVSVVLATIAVFLRMAARRMSGVGYWWDDYTIAAALVVQWAMGVTRWLIVKKWYYGHHVFYVGKSNLQNFQKAFVGIQTTYFLNAVLTKISLLFLYHRIFGVVKGFRIALWATAFIVIGFWIACTILAFLGCQPFERNWDKSVPGSCVDLYSFFRYNGIANLAIDFLILILPIPMVWRIKAPTRQRIELTGIFALGLFVCITSVMRVLSYRPENTKDHTFAGVDSMVWSQVEQGIGIVCACLPTLRPIILWCFPERLRSSKNKSSGNSMGMDNMNSDHKSQGRKSGWTTPHDSESTVGFARLKDEEGVLSPVDVQKSVYGPVLSHDPAMPIGAAVTTDATEPTPRTPSISQGIVRKTTIDQRTDPR